ncbi:putative queuosine salvage protein family [Plasmopara halstedii]
MGLSTDSLLARVRPSCSKLIAHEFSSVRINKGKARKFYEDLDVKEFEKLAEPMNFPLNFHSQRDELNFLTLYGLLNFGSGFRKDLHKYADRGAHDTIVFGLIGMYISVPKLDARYMTNLTIDLVANYFSIPLEKDEEVSPGIYMSKPGPLKPLAAMIQRILNECGQKLLDLKMTDFGAFVEANLSPKPSDDGKEKAKINPSSSAVYLVDQLVATFPGFGDHYEIHGEKVYLLKRAQLAVACIHRRFEGADSKLMFKDINKLTALSDNVLPCVLHAVGVLEYDPELEARINQNEELPAGQYECELRAAALVACDEIVKASKGRINILQLDYYLWRLGKHDRFRNLEQCMTQPPWPCRLCHRSRWLQDSLQRHTLRLKFLARSRSAKGISKPFFLN